MRSWSSFKFDEKQGNSFDFGNFDECLEIREVFGEETAISGQHCMVQFYSTSNGTVSNLPILSYFNKQWKDLDKRFGGAICIPSTCSVEVIPVLMSKVFNSTDFRLAMDYNQRDFCKTAADPNSQISPTLIALAVVTAVLIILVMIGTVVSWFSNDQTDKPKNGATIFSLNENLKTLTSTNQPPNDIKCLHGMKILSTLSIIYFHTCYHRVTFPHKDLKEVRLYSEHFFSNVETIMSTSVDLFFVVSGMLTTQKILKDFKS
jgi:Nose resistant-to-fluoxetine protein, N-terminal domain